jgi:hypothetical protein
MITLFPYAAAPQFDFSLADDYSITLTGNARPTFVNLFPNRMCTVRFRQNSVGGWTIAWPPGLTWIGGTPAVIPAAAHSQLAVGLSMSGSGILARVLQ